MKLLLAVALQIVLLCLQAKGLRGATYSIVHPKLFRIDSAEKVVVNLHGYGSANVRIDASLTDLPRRRETISQVRVEGNAAAPIVFALTVPRGKVPGAETILNKKVEMRVSIQFTSGGHGEIVKTIMVYLSGESDYIFVQTERPIYKPGELVSIRVTPLNMQMLPMRGRDDEFEVSIKTSEGIAIWKAPKRLPGNNFILAEYRIPDDPPLGTYFAEARLTNKKHNSTGSAEFKVDKYVLPTYNVEIQLEQSTVKPDGEIRGSFISTYSYGEEVVGTYGIVGTLHIPDREPLEFYQKPSHYTKRPGMLRENSGGAADIRIPMQKAITVSNMTWEELVEERATVSIVVSVMGKAEGIVESDIKEGILITNSPYAIDMSKTSKYFIPGQTHEVKVTVRDIVTNELVPDVNVRVRTGRQNREGRTGEKGSAEIVIDTEGSNQLHLTIEAEGADPAVRAEKRFLLERLDSSHGYLRMSAPGLAPVDDDVNVKFKCIGHQPSEIYYMVLSRGTIVLSGKVDVQQVESVASIPVTRKMSPSIRVVGYYMHGSNIVSDSVSIDVDDVCLSRELTIDVQPKVIRPGESVTIIYQGEPNSMLGTSAVDRAAYFLHDKGRLDRHKMFEKMKAFDMGCSTTGGSTPFNVFEEAGLACTAAGLSTPAKENLDCPQEEARRKKRNIKTLLGDYALQQRILIKRCYRDGRKENLANEGCYTRKGRIERLELADESICIEAFLEGCAFGESIRSSAQFRATKQRATGAVAFDVGSHPANIRRTNFDESWLWFTDRLNDNGGLTQSPAPPHSITTYDIDAVSVNDMEGFCVANPAELKVFKDFFIQLYLPYSVKVMEQVQIRAALFNYHDTVDREIVLKIKVDNSLCTQGTPGEWSTLATLSVPSESSESFIFTVIPLVVPDNGEAKIEIKTEPVNRDESARDEIRRFLKVEPTGSEEEFSGSFQLDPTSSPRKQIEFEFPDSDVVPDSKKCWIYGHMSYLGPIIEFDPISETPKDLDKSLQIPGGCGEQNMKRVGPNVFALNYLKYVGDPTPNTVSQVQKYIIAGYTNQQRSRNNGLWSVFSSAPPTIWLNAYVDRVFLHGREVWPDMDIGPICQSITWMVAQQRGDGSFYEAAHSRHYWVNVAEGGVNALTAYVLISIAEIHAGCPGEALKSRLIQVEQRATEFLRGTVNEETIPYTAAIVAYALALVNSRDASTLTANQRLLNMKRQSSDETFWQGPNRQHKQFPAWWKRKQAPIDIETTAYALLAQVAIARNLGSRVPQSTVEQTNRIARWMVSQQNDRGGFQSSQTTVIAIQSMTEYAKWIDALEPPPRNPHLTMTLRAAGTPWQDGVEFSLDGGNEFYRKELKVPTAVIEGQRQIDVTVTGEGRGSMSYRCVYRTTKNSEVCDFNIVASTERVGHFADDGESEAPPNEGKDVIKLVIEVSKITAGNSGMAIIDISLISGFKPVESTVKTLTDTVDAVLDHYEITGQNIILYVETIKHSEPLKLGFHLQQTVTVNDPSPAKILVYDYYKPEDTCSKFYSIPDGSPLIRTSCVPTSIDTQNEQLCKCAEGGCPTCRTREQQLDKTCGKVTSCYGCAAPYSRRRRECHILRDSVCARSYGFIMKVTGMDAESMPQFIKLTATVDEIIRTTADNELDRNQERTFVIRRDCAEKCSDVSLKDLSGGNDYFVAGRVYLVRGNKPMVTPTSDGRKRFDYFLDKEAVIERTLEASKCTKYESRRARCRGDNSERCQNVRKKLKICDNQRAMREGIHEGCD